jgi:hypothetical protein
MTVNDQHQGSRHNPQELLKKGDRLFSSQRMPVRLNTEPYAFAVRRNQQRTQQIETLIVSNTGPLNRGVASAGPGALKRRDQRKTAFIGQSEGSAQLATLFLSWAALPLSSVPPPHHSSAAVPVVAVDYSIPSAASHAKQHSGCSGPQTAARSRAQSGPVSSNLQHTRRRRRLDPTPSPAVSPGAPTISWADQAGGLPSSSGGAWLGPANVPHSAWLHSAAPQLPGPAYPGRAMPVRAPGSPPVVHLSLFVSCPYYDTTNDFLYSIINR